MKKIISLIFMLFMFAFLSWQPASAAFDPTDTIMAKVFTVDAVDAVAVDGCPGDSVKGSACNQITVSCNSATETQEPVRIRPRFVVYAGERLTVDGIPRPMPS